MRGGAVGIAECRPSLGKTHTGLARPYPGGCGCREEVILYGPPLPGWGLCVRGQHRALLEWGLCLFSKTCL